MLPSEAGPVGESRSVCVLCISARRVAVSGSREKRCPRRMHACTEAGRQAGRQATSSVSRRHPRASARGRRRQRSAQNVSRLPIGTDSALCRLVGTGLLVARLGRCMPPLAYFGPGPLTSSRRRGRQPACPLISLRGRRPHVALAGSTSVECDCRSCKGARGVSNGERLTGK